MLSSEARLGRGRARVRDAPRTASRPHHTCHEFRRLSFRGQFIRSTASESMFAARRAGTRMAATDTPQNNNVTEANVGGSEALTSKSKLANTRAREKTLRTP